ncbi:hypothetical protein P872_15915 [Rhodonellum psychrophilum GCM71 = DSM 17998]|uniref:Cytochrome c domain-containing protein n=2 Tax=Rhodonellum TaxID=336827 RepID=U5BZU0_9BACT|nr:MULTISPECIES: cytochrome c [Rhodonellum]ERM83328.1 hypothetical protein P872_15915 [Rhodonellum psychrophilum GCM71 = DSM 17998]SDZ38755.1 hypothetical protein SAMN05444412_11267 [Rhodonellum ikkaensis]
MKAGKTNLLLTVLMTTLFLFGFGLKYIGPSPKTPEISSGKSDNLKALKLLDQNCLSCHNPDMTGGHASRLAPPIFKVREHYYREDITKEEFTASILNFVKNPSEDKTKMRGAIRNFGLMPSLVIPQEDLELIVNYIYDNDLSSEAWKIDWDTFKKNQIRN